MRLLTTTTLITLVLNAHSSGILYPQRNPIRDLLSLDGIWNFALSEPNEYTKGYQEQWYLKKLKSIEDLTIELMPVPSSYNDISTDEKFRHHVGLAWYQREFIVPKNWAEKRTWIRFSSVCTEADVVRNLL